MSGGDSLATRAIRVFCARGRAPLAPPRARGLTAPYARAARARGAQAAMTGNVILVWQGHLSKTRTKKYFRIITLLFAILT